MKFSITKNSTIPPRIRKEIFRLNPPVPKDSGIKCRNAPPKREPTERETKNKSRLSRVFLLRKMNNIPISEISDTATTLRIINIT